MKLRYKQPFFNWLAQLFQKVSGVPPLTLPRAVAGGLKEVTAYGGCALNGIPSEYTELEYLQSDGNQYIDTGITLIHTDCIEIKFASVALSTPTRSFFGYMGGTGSSSPRFSFGTFTEGSITTYFGGVNATAKIPNTREDLQFHTIKNLYDQSSGRYTFVLDNQSTTFAPITGTSLTLGQAYIFRRKRLTDYTTDAPGTKISYVIWRDADKNLKAYFIPVKRKSDNELGMYDRVSHRFFTNQGTGTFVAGNAVTPSPDKPCEIWCNNGKLIPYLNAEGSSTQDGTPSPDNPVGIQNYTQGNMVLRGIGEYRDVYNSSTKIITRKVGVKIFNGTEDWSWSDNANAPARLTVPETISVSHTDNAPFICSHFESTYWDNLTISTRTIPYIAVNQSTNASLRRMVFTVRWSENITDLESWKQFLAAQYNAGTPVVVYYPLDTETTETWNDVVYTEGIQETITVGNSSANAGHLLKVLFYGRTYNDEQNIISGSLIRKCTIKIFDGSETLLFTGTSATVNRFSASLSYCEQSFSTNTGTTTICSHITSRISNTVPWTCYIFNKRFYMVLPADIFQTTQDVNNWLTNQYNAGTPVIVIYPLATPVTEQVEPQALDTVAGTNTLEITQASLPGLELTAEYKRH